MHRIAATPGGWNPQAEGVIFIEQTPAPIILITAADTDIQTLAASMAHLPPDFPAIRAVNLLQLQQELTIDTYTEQVLNQADVIIIRLFGGSAYCSQTARFFWSKPCSFKISSRYTSISC